MKPVAGFLSPPSWIDPSPEEFLTLTGRAACVQQCPMNLPDFDYRLENIGASEPQMITAAEILGDMGCDAIGVVGTPFAWAGLSDHHSALQRQKRLSDAAGKPVTMAGLAILEALTALKATRIGVCFSYYDDVWSRSWGRIISSAGFDIVASNSFTSLGEMDHHETGDRDYWYPDAELVRKAVSQLSSGAPELEAIVVSGAGCRTTSMTTALEEISGVPVVASDTALFWRLASLLEVRLSPDRFGTLARVAAT